MKFDWRTFCDERRVPYLDNGGDNIEIRCPLCGSADQGQHMSLLCNVKQPFWHCWRNSDHRGRNPAKLVAALLGTSLRMAYEVVKMQDDQAVDNADDTTVGTPPADRLLLPLEFKVVDRLGYGGRFVDYLLSRGFLERDWPDVVDRYQLQYCLVGEWKWRLIIPVRTETGQLITWTARSIIPNVELRYKTLSDKWDPEEPNAPRAIFSIKDVVYNAAAVSRGGKELIVTEGPFDAIKVDFYSRGTGAVATSLFGKTPTEEQMYMIAEAAQRFEHVNLLLDDRTTTDGWKISRYLRELVGQEKVRVLSLPPGVKDPGQLNPDDVKNLLSAV